MSQWISIGLMVAGAVVMLAAVGRRWVASRPVRAFTPIPAAARLAEIRERVQPRPDGIAEARAEAEDLAGQLGAMLEEKASRLERLLAAADERIARLERADGSPGLGSGGFIEARPSARGGVDPLSRQVYELADTGLAPVEIARRLDQLTGKVELILALRQR